MWSLLQQHGKCGTPDWGEGKTQPASWKGKQAQSARAGEPPAGKGDPSCLPGVIRAPYTLSSEKSFWKLFLTREITSLCSLLPSDFSRKPEVIDPTGLFCLPVCTPVSFLLFYYPPPSLI